MTYSKNYDSFLIRGNKKYKTIEHFENYLLSNFPSRALDIGCGTCKKLISSSDKFEEYIGLDINVSMIDKAYENLLAQQCDNVKLLKGNSFFIPFENESFDLVSCMLAPFHPMEMHRVLRPKGKIFLGLLGANDKKELKKKFGRDEFGWRGMNMNISNHERNSYLYTSLKPFFEEISISEYNWNTSLSITGFIELLNQTPTIRNFDYSKDSGIINLIAKKSKVVFKEHRIVITAIRRNLSNE